MTVFCPNCGAANEDFAEFCASCGESLAKARKAKGKQSDVDKESSTTSYQAKTLYRSRDNKILTGLSAGIAKYSDLDVTLVRVLWIVALIVTGFVPVAVIYFIMAAVIPEEPLEEKS